MPAIISLTTMDDVRSDQPTTIYYGVNTCWWTHRAEDLCKIPSNGMPCDPLGGMLLQTDDVDGFLAAAEANPGAYGAHGLRAFMAAHNDNCIVSFSDRRKTCLRTWDEYNDLLDLASEARPLTCTCGIEIARASVMCTERDCPYS